MPTEEICGFKSRGPTPWAVEVLGLPAGHGPRAPCGPPLSFQAVSPQERSDSPLFHSAVKPVSCFSGFQRENMRHFTYSVQQEHGVWGDPGPFRSQPGGDPPPSWLVVEAPQDDRRPTFCASSILTSCSGGCHLRVLLDNQGAGIRGRISVSRSTCQRLMS